MDASAGANSFPPASLGIEICHAKVLLAMDIAVACFLA